MSETKFTPGPWELHIGLDYFEIENRNGWCVLPETHMNPESELEVADAHLIAAAPELYEALESAQEELRLIRMKDCDAVYDPTLRVRMSAALKKARGEQ